jgi:nucleotide-binding universal stress UspA family protein
MAFRRILVPIDYSEPSRAALEYAGRFAVRLGASLDVVHVWDRPTFVPDNVMVGDPPRPLAALVADSAHKEMQEFIGRVALPPGVECGRHLISGEPASTCLERIKQGDYDLVVVGTHGRTGVRHLLLGSIAERLVRLSPVPVLTVPPGDH